MHRLCLDVILAFTLASMAVTHVLAVDDQDDDFDDTQTEFYLPYSETEDVDFNIARPAGSGCYQWSTNNTDVIRLDPIVTDRDRFCGQKLEFQILTGKCKGEKTTIKIEAENLDIDGFDSDAPAIVEYILHVHPVDHLEVLGLKTELTAGSGPVPFGIAGYDDEGNEFDTLDGLQITWFIGSNREIAMFERNRQVGPVTKLIPLKAGKGAILVVVSDPNYENVPPGQLDITISAPLMVEPDGVFLLEGAVCHFALLENGVNSQGNKEVVEFDLTKNDAEFSFELENPEIASLDGKTGNVTALKEGETSLLVKNAENEIVKSVPVRVTTANHVTVTVREHPDTTKLILENVYNIDVNIFNKDGRKIHPSSNILSKTTFSKHFEILEISESGLEAKVKASTVGLGRVKVSLRSVLTEDDEELEIIPHVKGEATIEVYEQVVINPKRTILPWDEDVKPTYELRYKATGGGQVYAWSTSDENMATADTEGTATTVSGPGSFKVRAAMDLDSDNYDEAVVHILPVTMLEIKKSHVETSIHTPITIAVTMATQIEGEEELALFTDCADVPYDITLSDEANFEIEYRFTRGNNRVYHACSSFTVRSKAAGVTCKVTVSYTEPTSGKVFKDSVVIGSYRDLKVVHPPPTNSMGQVDKSIVFMPVGSRTNVILAGGPVPWLGDPSVHFKQIEVDEPEIARVKKISDSDIAAPLLTDSYSDIHAYEVTCLEEGETAFLFSIGNTASQSNGLPISSSREVTVVCDKPSKVMVTAEPRLDQGESEFKYLARPSTNRILVNNNRDLLLSLVVKNAEGTTYHDISSLAFDVKISPEGLLKSTSGKGIEVVTPKHRLGEEFGKLEVNGKPYISLTPEATKTGEVDLIVAAVGFNEEVFKARGIKAVPDFPKVVMEDDSADDEDEEEFEAHHHNLVFDLDIELATEAEINTLRRQLV